MVDDLMLSTCSMPDVVAIHAPGAQQEIARRGSQVTMESCDALQSVSVVQSSSYLLLYLHLACGILTLLLHDPLEQFLSARVIHLDES